MSENIDNKCKSCGGELKYDPISGELKCTHCDSVVDIPEQVALNTKQNFTAESQASTILNDTTQYKCLRCEKSHTVVIGQDLERCPSCGSSEFEKKIDVTYKPDGIVPFKLNKEKALEAFVEWLKKRRFAPNNLRKLAKSKKIEAVYLPAYNYDMETTTEYSGTGHIRHRDSDGRTYTTSERFNKVRNTNYTDYLASANELVSGRTLRDMGNFGLNNMCVYRTEFLYGWVGVTNAINLQNNYNFVRQELADDIKRDIESKLNSRYSSISNFRCNTSFRNIKFNYVYLPVWINHYKYGKKDYYCYVNGYSGQVTGKAPKSFWKIFFLVLGILAAVAGIVYLTEFA